MPPRPGVLSLAAAAGRGENRLRVSLTEELPGAGTVLPANGHV